MLIAKRRGGTDASPSMPPRQRRRGAAQRSRGGPDRSTDRKTCRCCGWAATEYLRRDKYSRNGGSSNARGDLWVHCGNSCDDHGPQSFHCAMSMWDKIRTQKWIPKEVQAADLWISATSEKAGLPI